MAFKGLDKTKYFVLAFCVAFLVLMLFAMAMVTMLKRDSSAAVSEERAPPSVAVDDYYHPRAEDSLNLLLIGRDGVDDPPRYFFLVRLDAEEGKIPVAALPHQTVVRYAGRNCTLAELYARNGAKAVQQALGEALGAPVDRYLSFSGETLVQAVDMIGFVEYSLPSRLDYQGANINISLERGKQMIDGQKLYDILRYPGYGSELERGEAAADLLCAYINGRLETVLSPKSDAIFRGVINLVDSDISFVDYDSRKEALAFLAKLSSGQHAQSVLIRGNFNTAGDSFALSTSTQELLHRLYQS